MKILSALFPLFALSAVSSLDHHPHQPYTTIITSMRFLVLVAGTNDPSNADYLADRFIDGIKTVPGAEVDKVRLKDMPLPHFQVQDYACGRQGPEFDRVRGLIQSANGIVIASPVWNFSVPSHLKNFIDHIGCFALDAETRSKGQLKGVPCFCLFTGGAPTVAWRGLMRFTTMHVCESMRYFGASPAGTHFEGKCTKGKGRFGLILDQRPEVQVVMKNKGKKFALVAEHFAKTGQLPLSYRIIAKLYGWGQRILAKF